LLLSLKKQSFAEVLTFDFLILHFLMDLRKQLVAENSRANCNKIVRWVGKHQDRFDELFGFFTGEEPRLAQLSAWPVNYAAMAHPALIKKHLGRLLRHLDRPGIHQAVKRNTIRLLQDIDIPAKYHGKLMDTCFRYLTVPGESIAVKAFSLRVLQHLCDKYADIVPEVKLLIEENYDRETPSFKARARMFLKKYT
jgi:hypothetical protein